MEKKPVVAFFYLENTIKLYKANIEWPDTIASNKDMNTLVLFEISQSSVCACVHMDVWVRCLDAHIWVGT